MMLQLHRRQLDMALRFNEVLALLESLGCPEPAVVKIFKAMWIPVAMAFLTGPEIRHEDHGLFVFEVPQAKGNIERRDAREWRDVERAARWFTFEIKAQGYRP